MVELTIAQITANYMPYHPTAAYVAPALRVETIQWNGTCKRWVYMKDQAKCARWVRVANVEDIPPDTVTQVSIEGIDIAVCNAGGEFYAIGDTCTHAEASLADGDFYEDMRGWVLECPLHGSQFSVTTGDAISLPATGNSGKFDLRVEDGAIFLNPEPVTPREE